MSTIPLDQIAIESYWRKAFEGASMPTPLTVDKPASKTPDGAIDWHVQQLTLTDEVSTRLSALVDEKEFALEAVAYSVWAILLSRYSGHSDVIFGTPSSTTSSFLPFRLNIAPEESVLELLTKVHSNISAQSEASDVLLSDIRGWVDCEPGASLFESSVIVISVKYGAQSENQAS